MLTFWVGIWTPPLGILCAGTVIGAHIIILKHKCATSVHSGFDAYVFASQSLEDFIWWCYPCIDKPTMSIAGKAILAPKHSHVDELNQVALSLTYAR